MAVLPTPGSPIEHDRVGPLAVAEDLQHLLDLVIAPVNRRDLVLTRQQVQVGCEILEERRKLESLTQVLLAKFVLSHTGNDARDQYVRLDAMTTDDGDRNPLALFKDG